MPAISTPCTKICLIDRASGLCEGCGRTLLEIGRWPALNEAERKAIMKALGARLRRLRADVAARDAAADR